MAPTKFPATPEQQTALGLYATGKSMKIEAGAGTGKTSTLQLLAESANRRIQYVAFNKAIVEESKSKFPSNVRCNTAHSLAFRDVGKHFSARLNSPRMRGYEIASALGIKTGLKVEAYTGETKMLSAERLASLTMAAVERWCQTADSDPAATHMPAIRGLDDPMGRGPWAQRNARSVQVGEQLVPYMQRAWKDLCRYDGTLRFTPSHYLKMWQLDPKTKIWTDVIMFDEAQDASPVLIDVVARQTHAQIVWVGDTNQQIYEFTGAVNALAKVPVENTGYLSQSFRFGPAIAATANTILRELRSPLQLRGFEKIQSTVGTVDRPKAILTRTNATAVRELLTVVDSGRTGHLVGGGQDVLSFARAAEQLKRAGSTDHPELFCFDSWDAVTDYVEHDEQGGDLRLLVKLYEEFGIQTIERALASMATEEKADTIISTAHKSKGRQWATVKLAGDFPEGDDDAERRLLYVAVTRAQERLDVTDVPQINGNGATAPQEAAGDDAAAEATTGKGGQHRAPQAPAQRVLLILDGQVYEVDDLDRAEEAAAAFHTATGKTARVVDGVGEVAVDLAREAVTA